MNGNQLNAIAEMGHDEKECRRKNKERQEWRRVPPIDEIGEANAGQEQQPDDQRTSDGFTTPRREIQRSGSRPHAVSHLYMQNSFQALMDEEVCEGEARRGDIRITPNG